MAAFTENIASWIHLTQISYGWIKYAHAHICPFTKNMSTASTSGTIPSSQRLSVSTEEWCNRGRIADRCHSCGQILENIWQSSVGPNVYSIRTILEQLSGCWYGNQGHQNHSSPNLHPIPCDSMQKNKENWDSWDFMNYITSSTHSDSIKWC